MIIILLGIYITYPFFENIYLKYQQDSCELDPTSKWYKDKLMKKLSCDNKQGYYYNFDNKQGYYYEIFGNECHKIDTLSCDGNCRLIWKDDKCVPKNKTECDLSKLETQWDSKEGNVFTDFKKIVKRILLKQSGMVKIKSVKRGLNKIV